MTAEWIPPGELDSPPPAGLSPAQLVGLWLEMTEASDRLLMAGFRATHRSEAEARDAYRRWHQEHAREHYEHLERMAERFHRSQPEHGCTSNIADA